MLSKKSKDIFQDYMPNNICFGCGNNTKDGLHIKSYWQGEMAECIWTPKSIHQGWRGIMNGGIIATDQMYGVRDELVELIDIELKKWNEIKGSRETRYVF